MQYLYITEGFGQNRGQNHHTAVPGLYFKQVTLKQKWYILQSAGLLDLFFNIFRISITVWIVSVV
jgi:hypothetical protein